MKKIAGWIIIILLSIGSIVIVNEKSKIYKITENNDTVEINIKYKGLKGSVDFTTNNDKMYIAYPHKIKCIENGKEPYTILSDETLNISSIESVSDKIFFVSGNKLMSYDTSSMLVKKYIENIPNNGDYKNVILKSYKDKLYITIGSMTNSGVVGDDNTWLSENNNGYDLSPETIKLNENLKGAYVKKDQPNNSGEIIKQSTIGNSSILVFDINTSEYKTFAWGIRNVNGLDITEDGKIYAAVGGYEPRGERPIYNDSDYIYEIKKGYWYGFPDYSGGDSLQSPRFNMKGNEKVKMILSEIPMNPPAPYYQHNDLNSLSWLVIDKIGKIAKNNESSIFIYNKNENSIYYGIIGGVFDKFISLNKDCVVDNMKSINNELYILDSNKGFIYSIEGK